MEGIHFGVLIAAYERALGLGLFGRVCIRVPVVGEGGKGAGSRNIDPFRTRYYGNTCSALPPTLLAEVVPTAIVPLDTSDSGDLFLVNDTYYTISMSDSFFFVLRSVICRYCDLFYCFCAVAFNEYHVNILYRYP